MPFNIQTIIYEFNPLNHFFRLGSPLVSPNYLFTPGATLSDFNQQLLSILADERLVIENNNQSLAPNTTSSFVLDQTDDRILTLTE